MKETEPVTAYCDGSGKGLVCAIFDYGEGYYRAYFDSINDHVNFEYEAILFALERMTDKEDYVLYSDSQAVINQINGGKIKTDMGRYFKQRIKDLVVRNKLSVEFKWIVRNQNKAGWLLDMPRKGPSTPPEQEWFEGLEGKRITLNPEVRRWWRGW